MWHRCGSNPQPLNLEFEALVLLPLSLGSGLSFFLSFLLFFLGSISMEIIKLTTNTFDV